jgi:Tol biopolymer transport system component
MHSRYSAPRRRALAAATRAAGALLALCLFSCNKQYPNPFANTNAMTPPSAAAQVVFVSNLYSAKPGGGKELYAAEGTGANVTRLTNCNTTDRRCDYLEPVTSALSRSRLAVLRLLDTDGDGNLTANDGTALHIVDLSRQVEGELVPGNAHVTGADWSPGEEVLYYSAAGQTPNGDLYTITSNAQSNTNLTMTDALSERRPRFNSAGTSLLFERIDPATGLDQVWIATGLGLRVLTTGGTPGAALAGTPYIVGSDADPVFSPDGNTVLFRRLVATGNGGLGMWDLMTVRLDTSDVPPAVFVTGPAYRGPADWGPLGIVFIETVAGSGPQMVLVDTTGGSRKVLVTAGAGFDVASPHWLH